VLVLIYMVLHRLIFGNIGYAYRQRTHLLPWLLMVAAVGRERRRERAASPVPKSATSDAVEPGNG
jgi:hypothetical protein